MITFIRNMLSKKTTRSLSAFMKDAPRKEREQIFADVVRRSNADQRDLVKKYAEKQRVGASR